MKNKVTKKKKNGKERKQSEITKCIQLEFRNVYQNLKWASTKTCDENFKYNKFYIYTHKDICICKLIPLYLCYLAK